MSSAIATAPETQRSGYRRLPRLVLYSLTQYTIQWLLVIVVIFLSAANSNFRQQANLLSILRQASFAGIGAAGMTLLIISGAFDLSVAGMLGLCGVVLAKLLPGHDILAGIVLTLLLGILLGVINGLVVTKVRVPAFVATLGMMYIYLAVGFRHVLVMLVRDFWIAGSERPEPPGISRLVSCRLHQPSGARAAPVPGEAGSAPQAGDP